MGHYNYAILKVSTLKMDKFVHSGSKITLCKVSEFDELIDFIRENWKSDHVFIKCPPLLKWQHLNGGYLNFIIARNTADNKILGVLGYIPTSQYDCNLTVNKDTWGAIWKVVDNAPLGLGMKLMEFFQSEIQPSSYGSIGNSGIALSLYKLTKYTTGTLSQYFILSSSIDQFNIAKAENYINVIKSVQDEASIKELEILDDLVLDHAYYPQKSIRYLINRYSRHPIYKYRFFGAYIDDLLVAIFVIRKQSFITSSCLRLVDIYGDMHKVGRLYNHFQKIMKSENAEYIDCYNFGIDEKIFEKVGFSKLDIQGDTVIPNYFEPFEKKNVVINFAFKTSGEEYVIFKGDSDQDRPSLIKEF